MIDRVPEIGEEITMLVHLEKTQDERTGQVIAVPKHRRFAVVLFKGEGSWGGGGYYRECCPIAQTWRFAPPDEEMD